MKRIETTIASLKMRTDSTDKKVRDKAAEFLRKICNKIIYTLGILDIYRLLGGFSSLHHFHIRKIQQKLLNQMQSIEKLMLALSDEHDEVE